MKQVVAILVATLGLSAGLASAEALSEQEVDTVMQNCLSLVAGIEVKDINDTTMLWGSFVTWANVHGFKSGQADLAFNMFLRLCIAEAEKLLTQRTQALPLYSK